MIDLADLAVMVGWLIGSFGVGYAGGYVLNILRRVLWMTI